MIMNLILVWMVCQCNVYVIPESIRKDLGYKTRDRVVLIPRLAQFRVRFSSLRTIKFEHSGYSLEIFASEFSSRQDHFRRVKIYLFR